MQHDNQKKQLVLEEMLKGLTAQLETIKKDHEAELQTVRFWKPESWTPKHPTLWNVNLQLLNGAAGCRLSVPGLISIITDWEF